MIYPFFTSSTREAKGLMLGTTVPAFSISATSLSISYFCYGVYP
jgi:hypothetical protein